MEPNRVIRQSVLTLIEQNDISSYRINATTRALTDIGAPIGTGNAPTSIGLAS